MTFSTSTNADGLFESKDNSVTKDFNVHIETSGDKADRVDIYVSSSSNATKKQCIFSKYFSGTFDHDFEAKVYPKKVTVCCTSLPDVADLTIAS